MRQLEFSQNVIETLPPQLVLVNHVRNVIWNKIQCTSCSHSTRHVLNTPMHTNKLKNSSWIGGLGGEGEGKGNLDAPQAKRGKSGLAFEIAFRKTMSPNALDLPICRSSQAFFFPANPCTYQSELKLDRRLWGLGETAKGTLGIPEEKTAKVEPPCVRIPLGTKKNRNDFPVGFTSQPPISYTVLTLPPNASPFSGQLFLLFIFWCLTLFVVRIQ